MAEGVSSNTERTPSQEFQKELNDILYTPLNVENIGRFADDALNELIELNESVVHRYQQEHPESDTYSDAALEDAAYAAYSLENLGVVLDRITAVRDRIASLAVRIQASLTETGSVIVPPDRDGPAFQDTGKGNYEAPDRLNRLITLAYILETDFDIDQDNVSYTQGSTTDSMVRQEPYVRVEIEDLNRVVYVCDEEGNASYIFDTEILGHLGISVIELDQMTKNQRNAFLRITPEAGRRIVQSPTWRSVVSEALREPFSIDGKVPAPSEVVSRSEFVERGFLEFDDFVTEVRVAYKEAESPRNLLKWYQGEYKRRSGWPSTPTNFYKDKGWQSYPELVGQEKVDFLEFTDFVLEVQLAYEEAGSPEYIGKWYKGEYKNHSGWPADPQRLYKDKGWQSFPELVGLEKVKFLEFDDFVAEVRSAYQITGQPKGIQRWYEDEFQKHTGWPSNPHIKYQANGWRSYPELVGKEVKEFLNYEDFVEEVRALYSDKIAPAGIAKWYKSEFKKHLGWPSEPEKAFKKVGWVSYLELVGKEVTGFLKYDDFLRAVKVSYDAAGQPNGVQKWYRLEFRKHAGWPSQPEKTYNKDGLKGYPELVGKEVKEFLNYEDFVLAVRVAYEAAGQPNAVQDWYEDEFRKHSGWPSAPDSKYRHDGWKSYPELVGKEVKEFLNYEDFVLAVRVAYEAAGQPNNIQQWYRAERKKHSRWFTNPDQSYKDKGWLGYPELVGKI
jgi:hypothetical protein